MIDIWAPPRMGGGCYECGAEDDRADDIAEFQLGTWRIRLCRAHRLQFEDALVRFREREAAEPGAPTPVNKRGRR